MNGYRGRRLRGNLLALVCAAHLLGLWWLLAWRAPTGSIEAPSTLAAFDVPPPPPQPVVPTSQVREVGRAAPPAHRAIPRAVTAPVPVLVRPEPQPAAPLAAAGAAPTAGAVAAGPGTGAEGAGMGLGSGGAGSGTGGGTRARLIAGAIDARDYPGSAREGGAMGTVEVRFTVDAAGRVTGCRVSASSGNPALDGATCTLVTARFRYAPARDAAGRAVAEPRGWRQRWWFAGR